MEIMAVILAVVIGFIVLKFISGMVKFAVLGVILLALFYFMTGGVRRMSYTGPLADKDRIFTNVYGFQSPGLKAAQARGDWDDTAKLMQIGQDAIIDDDQGVGLRGRGGAGFPTGMKWGFMPKEPKPGQTQFPGHQRRRDPSPGRARTARSSATIRTS